MNAAVADSGVAALPMYDRPETVQANDRLWQATRKDLGHGPEALTRGADPWDIWCDPGLVLAQTCGLPYRARLHGTVTLVGAPVCDLPDCAAGDYYSVLVVRADDQRTGFAQFEGATLAFNGDLSQSGWAAPTAHAAQAGLRFGGFVRSGAHGASARLVATGRADIAALDALTWRLMCRTDPIAHRLRVLEHTHPTPALPYITAAGCNGAAMFSALEVAFANLSEDDRDTLGIRGVVPRDPADYLAQPIPAPPPADTPTDPA